MLDSQSRYPVLQISGSSAPTRRGASRMTRGVGGKIPAFHHIVFDIETRTDPDGAEYPVILIPIETAKPPRAARLKAASKFPPAITGTGAGRSGSSKDFIESKFCQSVKPAASCGSIPSRRRLSRAIESRARIVSRRRHGAPFRQAALSVLKRSRSPRALSDTAARVAEISLTAVLWAPMASLSAIMPASISCTSRCEPETCLMA